MTDIIPEGYHIYDTNWMYVGGSQTFWNTYDQNSGSYAQRTTNNQSFFCDWTWTSPHTLNGIQINSNYLGYSGNYISNVWGLNASGSATLLWSGTWHPAMGSWDTLTLTTSMSNCYGMRIGFANTQTFIIYDVKGYITSSATYSLSITTQPSAAYGTVTANPPNSPGYSTGWYLSGTTVTLTATANPGYNFSYWDGDVSGNSISVPIVMTTNKTVNAHFVSVSDPTCTISFSPDSPVEGGSLTATFTWTNAVPIGGLAAAFYLNNPSGSQCTPYYATSSTSGTHSLTCSPTVQGQYEAYAEVFGGSPRTPHAYYQYKTVSSMTTHQGACCFGTTCNPAMLASDCESQGGSYQGDNTSCSPNPCGAGQTANVTWSWTGGTDQPVAGCTLTATFQWKGAKIYGTGTAACVTNTIKCPNCIYDNCADWYSTTACTAQSYNALICDTTSTGTTRGAGIYSAYIGLWDGSVYVQHGPFNIEVLALETVGIIDIPGSTFYAGPFAPGAIQVPIADAHLGNYGTTTGVVYTRYFYLISGEWIAFNTTPFSTTINPTEWVTETHSIDIPSTMPMGIVDIGMKVWGAGETEPACVSPTGAIGVQECINGYTNTCSYQDSTLCATNGTQIDCEAAGCHWDGTNCKATNWVPSTTTCTGCKQEGVQHCINGYLNTCIGGVWTPTTTPCTGLEYRETAADNTLSLIVAAAGIAGIAGVLWYTKKKKIW